MIKYNNSNINDWNFYTSDIVKVYRNNVVIYYKVTTSGETPSQTPCYAVVDDISQYQDTEFVDVYNKADSKWYKLNNLNQYEQYGVYGSGRNITYYEGKLTIDNGYEYQYSGGSWVNLGEVSGSSRVPQGYTEVEYVQNTSRSYINTGFKPNQDTRIVADMQAVSNSQYGRFMGAGGYSTSNGMQFDYESYITGTLHISWGGINNWTIYSNCTGDYNRHTYDWDKNYFYRDKGEANQFSASTTYTSFQCTSDLGIFTFINNGSPSAQYSTEYLFGKLYSFKIYDNNTLVRDLVPVTRNSDNLAGVYDIVNDVFYYTPNYSSYPMTAGNPVSGGTEYPIYYDDKSDPPNNLSFSSMTEAEEYECPWVGMRAAIDGTRYVFSGDSQSGYEWVEIISPIPSEYNELEYIEVPRVSRTTTSANLFAVPVDLQAYHKYVFDFTPVNFWDTSYYGVMLGGNDGDTNFHDLGIFKLDNGWGTGKMIVSCLNYQLGRTKFNISPYIIQNTRTVISMNMNGYVANNGASISIESNGVEVFTGSSTTKANSSYNPTIGIRNVPLLDMGSSGNKTYTANLKFHNFAVMTSSDELVYNYLPVERISDGQAGLFETVNQVFYPLLGYTVTKGDPV